MAYGAVDMNVVEVCGGSVVGSVAQASVAADGAVGGMAGGGIGNVAGAVGGVGEAAVPSRGGSGGMTADERGVAAARDSASEGTARAAGMLGGRTKVLQVQRTRSREARESTDGRSAMWEELEEFRATSRLHMQRLLAPHSKDVEEMVSAYTEWVTATIEPLMRAFAVAHALAPPPLAPDALADHSRPMDHCKIRVHTSKPVDRNLVAEFVSTLPRRHG